MLSKKDLRKSFRRRLIEVTDERPPAEMRLNERIVEFMSDRPGCWASFQPAGFEPDIRPAMSQLPNCEFVFPRVEGDEMSFYSAVGEFKPNQWGIMEPDPAHSRAVAFTELEGLLIPALAFDTKCNRLGRGGGFYDRTLADVLTQNPEALKIGIALDRQISPDDLPTEKFDVPMDWVLTESRSLTQGIPS